MENKDIGNVGQEEMFNKFKSFMDSQPKPEVKATIKKNKKTEVVVETNDVSSSSDEIEKKPSKAKRQLTEKQKEGLQRGREKRDQLRRERSEAKSRQDAEYKKQVEQKIVKKAIQIKKKQIKQQKIIESDTESEIEVKPRNAMGKDSSESLRAPSRPRQQQYAQPPQQQWTAPRRNIVFL